MNKAPFVNSYVSFEIKNDILYVIYLPGAIINIDIAKDIVKQRMEYSGGHPYLMLITGEGLRAINKEARDYLSADGTVGVIAGALLVNSVYTEFFGNFFLSITKPEIPAKLFTDEEKALEWLVQFKPKS